MWNVNVVAMIGAPCQIVPSLDQHIFSAALSYIVRNSSIENMLVSGCLLIRASTGAWLDGVAFSPLRIVHIRAILNLNNISSLRNLGNSNEMHLMALRKSCTMRHKKSSTLSATLLSGTVFALQPDTACLSEANTFRNHLPYNLTQLV
jgi:hypothetical protein